MPNSSPRRSTSAATSRAPADLSPPARSIGIMPSTGKRYFVFHDRMYSALPTKLMLRRTDSIRNAESMNEMWLGHRIAGPVSGRRSKPCSSMSQRRRANGASNHRARRCASPAPLAFTTVQLQHDAEQFGRGSDPAATRTGRGCGVDRGERGGRVEVVIETLAHGGEHIDGRAVLRRRGSPRVEARPRLRHQLLVPLPLRAVVVADDGEADRRGVPLLAQRVDEDEVAEALRHLLAVLGDQRRVHPVLYERLARRRLRLRPL